MIIAQTATLVAILPMFYFLRGESAMPPWAAHKVLEAVGLYALFLRPHFHLETSIIVTNLSLMAGYSCLWAGARLFLRKPLHLWAHILPPLAAMMPILWYTFGEASALHRAFVSGIVYTLFSGLATLEYWQGDTEGKRTIPQQMLGAVLFMNTFIICWFTMVVPLDVIEFSFLASNLDSVRVWLASTIFIDFFYTASLIVVIYERLHEKNKETMEKLQDMLDEQKQFMLMLSHEFKNPLAAIGRSADFLDVSLSPLPETLKIRLDNIRERVHALDQLVGMFLRYESERRAFNESHLSITSMEHIWAEVTQYFDKDVISKRVMVDIAQQSHTILCDPFLLSSAASTILDNALKYSSPDAPVFVEMGVIGNVATITIKDRGIGIPRKDLSVIPKRFYRAGNAKTKGGSGLGLTMAQWVMTHHDGKLRISSEEDVGTVVSLVFPAHKPHLTGHTFKVIQ